MNNDESMAVEPEMNAEAVMDKRRELLGEELMVWNIKALPHSTFEMDVGIAIGAMIPFSIMLYGFFGEQSNSDLQGFGAFGVCFIFFLWKMAVKQKNVYQYRITDQGGEVRYWADFPKHFGTFFKCVSGLFLFVVICMIAVNPAFIWLLAGAGGMALAGARFFFGWENKKEYEWFVWDDYEHVIIDRKRRVVAFLDHPLVFEAFLERDQIDKYLDTIRPYMPPNTRYEERQWNE
jgi:hypothetical protein